ncbi:hypothetical protein ZYGR_0H04500 [Zygosaccharomyces rouxii]|uniref:ZYRO0B14366p n=2 Tax=Zygosaccharomyces rouxii TaxID=4956 RepID=C5DS71_ZYGRC|nr:uncharacterized protein ZYRO0B14366g [Zygosaccharomyces rouxii]KAH9199839.1 hypothetical protein LQ764DRAFT_209649 [Zygosaccharomyces rouxii]GAV47604.1 hypothetical protein ZYGR_0H04500 [Zygosaccharomyces rouxii]CAR26632.1 ZYRO0B14366p [Zygosaccharomyces rouxii]
MVDNIDNQQQQQLEQKEHQVSNTATPIAVQDLAAEWRTKEYKKQSQLPICQNEVMLKMQEATRLLKECKGEEPGTLQRMEWDSLYDVSANVMDEYTKNVDAVLAEMDQLYRKQYLWQEAAFVMDSHRGATMIGRAEEWMKLKEQHLGFRRKELDRSASVIRKTIERLTSEK